MRVAQRARTPHRVWWGRMQRQVQRQRVNGVRRRLQKRPAQAKMEPSSRAHSDRCSRSGWQWALRGVRVPRERVWVRARFAWWQRRCSHDPLPPQRPGTFCVLRRRDESLASVGVSPVQAGCVCVCVCVYVCVWKKVRGDLVIERERREAMRRCDAM
jgi:hypothetical protein